MTQQRKLNSLSFFDGMRQAFCCRRGIGSCKKGCFDACAARAAAFSAAHAVVVSQAAGHLWLSAFVFPPCVFAFSSICIGLRMMFDCPLSPFFCLVQWTNRLGRGTATVTWLRWRRAMANRCRRHFRRHLVQTLSAADA